MAPRKNRSRKTADRMAAYKVRMDKDSGPRSGFGTPRKSPRRAVVKGKTAGSTVSSQPAYNETSNRCNQKDPSGAYHSKDGFSKNDDVVRKDVRSLETLVEIPETPPRMSQVGRKRTLAPRSLGFGKECAAGDSNDCQKPSKKRKSFNTPPRVEVNKASDPAVDDNDESHPDPALKPGKAVPTSQSGEGILEMELLDQEASPSFVTGKDSDQNLPDWTFKLLTAREFSTRNSPLRGSEEDLEYISTSSQAISRHFKAIKKQVLEEMRALYRRQKTDLRELHESFVNPLVSEVKDIRSVMEMMCSGMKGSGSGKSGPKTSLHEWEEKLNQLTPKAEVVFSKEIFARILCFNAPWKMCEVFENGSGGLGSKVSIAAQVLLFSHQPSSKKNDFSDGFGKLHSEFKYSVIQNTFYNVCKRDTFDLFRSTGEGGTPVASALGVERTDQCRISRPKWLQSGYVSVDHINDARNFMESTNQSRKAKIRGTPSPDDIGSHGALRVYRQLGAHLHRGRDHMKTAFFQNMGYLFSPWRDSVKDSDQRKMFLSFPHEDACKLSEFRLENIPCTDLCTFGADMERTNYVNAGNRDLLKRVFSEWPCLVLCAEYEVEVLRTAVGQRKRPNVEKRKLRRLINLIEVACNVLVEYTRVGSIDMLLRGHKYALRCVMIFAILIRELTSEFIAMRDAIVPDPEDPQKTVPDAELVLIHNTSLKALLPGKSVFDAQLRPKFLRITEKMYDTWNVEDDDGETEHITRSGEAFVVTEIAESDEFGVAAI